MSSNPYPPQQGGMQPGRGAQPMPSDPLMQQALNRGGMGGNPYPTEHGAQYTQARDSYGAWQDALAEVGRLEGMQPGQDWQPQTRRGKNGTEMLIGGRWANANDFQNPALQPYIESEKAKYMEKAAAAHARRLAEARSAASMMEFAYNQYNERLQDIKQRFSQTAPSLTSSSAGSNRMLGGR